MLGKKNHQISRTFLQGLAPESTIIRNSLKNLKKNSNTRNPYNPINSIFKAQE